MSDDALENRVRLIVDAEPAHAEEALRTLLSNRYGLGRCKVGWGWATWRSGGPGFWLRRTKTGFSIRQTSAPEPSDDR